MLELFIIIQGALIFAGIVLLLFYAKVDHRLDKKISTDSGKIKTPRPVKIYALILLAWIIISSAYLFLQLLS